MNKKNMIITFLYSWNYQHYTTYIALVQRTIMYTKNIFKITKNCGKVRVGGGDYKTSEQHIANENWQRRVKPKSVSQTLASGILLREKKLLMNQYSHALFCMSVLIERV